MIKACVIGASGYTGAELVRLLQDHEKFTLCQLYVSENSADAHKNIVQLYPSLNEKVDLPLLPVTDETLTRLAQEMDAIFLATPHQASHDWMTTLASEKAKVFDLSGAFRIKDKQTFADFYGFEHLEEHWLKQAQYGLADWYPKDIASAKVVAVPGCYPTASLTALKPLQDAGFIEAGHRPIINAVSGVSGAGRKAAANTSFCEVSLQAYGVLGHRHQPEIAAYLGTEVIFTPHLGNFKRGILATCTVKIKDGVTEEQINTAYATAYQDTALVRLQQTWPKLDDVVNTPYCDLFWKLDKESGYLVVTSAIDNLLKGAASQALQCANLAFDLPGSQGLVSGAQA